MISLFLWIFFFLYIYFACRVIYIFARWIISVVWKVARKIIYPDKIWENYELKFNKKSCIFIYTCVGYKDVETRERILYQFSLNLLNNSGNNAFIMLIFHWISLERTYNIINIKSNWIEVILSNVKNNSQLKSISLD